MTYRGRVHHYRRTCVSAENRMKFNKRTCGELALRKSRSLRMLDFEPDVVARTHNISRLVFGSTML